ncbi:MAG TPA: SPASM domain-containing protein [Candidatus Margulisiibacteriota bacterium]|nr:SPASM domain-containing protein [Candidatus Margulisiibacteriota bacterium]
MNLSPYLFTGLKKILPCTLKQRFACLRYDLFNVFSSVSIETSAVCNRRCWYCPNSLHDRGGSASDDRRMEDGLFRKIIDELARKKWYGKIELDLYNEPLMDDRIVEFVSYTRKKLRNSFISMATNGDFLTIDIFNALVNAGMNEFVITRHDKEDSAMVKALKEYLGAQKKETARVHFKILEYITSRGGLITSSVDPYKRKYCEYPLWAIFINYKGDMLFCCEDYLNTVKLGNVKHESLFDIWNKPYNRKLRKEIRRGDFTLPICKKCGFLPNVKPEDKTRR